MRTLVGGGDLGNTRLKLVISAADDVRLANPIKLDIPNAVKQVAKGRKRGNMSSNEEIMDTLDVHISCPHNLDLHDKRFFVGPLAVKNGALEVSPKRKKTDNPFIMIPFLTGLALQSDEPVEEICCKFLIGLPVKEFKDRDLRNEFINSLGGVYDLTFISTTNLEGWKVKIHLDVAPQPEGLPVIFNQMFDNAGKMICDLRGKPKGVIDLGGHTTNIPITNELLKADTTLSTGLENGVYTALDEMRDEIRREFGVSIARQQCEDYIVNRGCILPIGEESFSIQGIVDEHFGILADDISSVIQDVLANSTTSNEIDKFFVAGGGGLLIPKYFEKLQNGLRSTLVYTDDPVFETAQGLAKLACVHYRVA